MSESTVAAFVIRQLDHSGPTIMQSPPQGSLTPKGIGIILIATLCMGVGRICTL